jgi:PAS domain S-box-containing protein
MYRKKPTYEELEKKVRELEKSESDHKLAMEALSKEKKFTEIALNTQLDTFFLFEPTTGKAISWNSAFKNVSGYTDEEIANMVAPDSYYSPEDLERAALSNQQILETGTCTVELELICKDGHKVPTEYQVSLIKDEQSKSQYFISIGRDITERKQAKEALSEIQELLSETSKIAKVGGWKLNLATQKLTWTEEVSRIHEVSVDYVPVLSEAIEFYAEESKPIITEAVQKAIETGEPYDLELQFITAKGNLIWVQAKGHAHRKDGITTKLTGTFQDITKRKQTEEELQKSAIIIDSTLVAVVNTDTEGSITFWNKGAERIYGYRKEEVLGKPVSILYKKKDLPILESMIADLMQGIDLPEIEVTCIDKNRNDVHILLSLMTLKDTYGNITELVGINTDITERKRAVDALLKEKQVAEEYINSLPGLFYVYDEARLVKWNKAWERTTGYTDEDLATKEATDFFEGEDKTLIWERLQKVFRDGEAVAEAVLVTKDGRRIPYFFNGVRKRIKGKDYAVGLGIDISGHKRSKEALVVSEAKFQDLYENAPDMYASVDAKTAKILQCNQTLLTATGYSREDIIGLPIRDLYHPDCLESVKEVFHSFLTTGEVSDTELELKRKDGTKIDVSLSVSSVRDKEGNILNSRSTWREISERKQLEEERNKAARLESIGVLAGGIAHDFNNILSVILGNISLANMITEQEKSEASEILTDADAACSRARELTQQLLTFSKGGAPVKKTTSLSALTKEASGFALRGSNVKCRHYIDKDLWPCEIDEGQISQVINNLIINADQAMPDGGTISIRARNITVSNKDKLPLNEGRYVKLTVKDQGKGISEQSITKIFDPYYTTKQKGSGLGLTTSYSIIKRHGGYITVKSEPKVGTAFYVYLPASWKRVEENEVKKKDISVASGKILVMDDEQALREVVSKMLEQLGHEVECASNGIQALMMYKKAKNSAKPFDAVILDLTVPGSMGGLETIEKLLKIDPEVKAIVSSGYSNDPVIASHGDYGFCSAVSKPYRIEVLREVLQNVMPEKDLRSGKKA